MEIYQEIKSRINVGQRSEKSEQKSCGTDQSRLPLSEDHNRKGEESETCNTVLEFPLADACRDVDDTAETAERTGDQNARVAHFQDIDTDGVSSLRMLAACHEAKTEFGLVEDYMGRYKDQHCE